VGWLHLIIDHCKSGSYKHSASACSSVCLILNMGVNTKDSNCLFLKKMWYEECASGDRPVVH
jgi:hypothetical protein